MDKQGPEKQALPGCLAQYLTQIHCKMRFRKKIRQEVVSELTGHFEDALGQGGPIQDRERFAQDLIAEFGDVRVLARLMRRAKKRCRPLWRKVLVRGFQGTVLLFAILVCYTIAFIHGEPAPRTDYLAIMNEKNRPTLQVTDNAWPHYEKAAQLFKGPSQRIEELNRYRSGNRRRIPLYADLTAKQRHYLENFVQVNQQHWERFDVGLRALLLRYVHEGLVPYDIDPVALREPEGFAHRDEHRLVDSLICNTVVRSQLVADASYGSELLKFEAVLKDAMDSWPVPLPLSAGDPTVEFIADVLESPVALTFDPKDELDLAFSQWLQENTLPEQFQMGVRVGALKVWMESESRGDDSMTADMCPFVERSVSKWLAENQSAWREFELAVSKPYCYREYASADPNSQWLMQVELPHLNDLRGLARLARWRARVQLNQGDSAGAVDSSLAAIRAGHDLQRFPTLIEQLVGIAMNSLGHHMLRRIVAEAELSDEALQRISDRLASFYPEGFPMVNPDFEKLAFYDTIQHVFTDGGPGGGHIVPRQLASLSGESAMRGPVSLWVFPVGLVHARRNKTVQVAERLFDRLADMAQLTPYQRQQADLSTDGFLSELPWHRYALVLIMMPSLDRCFELGYRIQTEHAGLMTVLALQRWQADQGSYPATLDELVTAGYLSELPPDPFGDGPLTYRRGDEGFTLYSFGTNLTDDSGKPSVTRSGEIRNWTNNGDTVLWPVMD